VALVDTAAEILGIAVALDDLGLFEAKIYATPLAVGGGTVKFSHGIVSVPAPATLAILQSKNFPFHGGPIEAELATPTGAAILVNLVDEVTRFILRWFHCGLVMAQELRILSRCPRCFGLHWALR
jgi:uncharacterized protein (DUF111 family)